MSASTKVLGITIDGDTWTIEHELPDGSIVRDTLYGVHDLVELDRENTEACRAVLDAGPMTILLPPSEPKPFSPETIAEGMRAISAADAAWSPKP